MALTAHHKMQMYGALLLLPAAVLLATFAYLPTITTVIQSLFLPGFRGAPPEFVGLENYHFLFDDAKFWKVARNNLIYALGTIPASIA
ncbi:MAG: sugar ABC transporter permease, partial [Halomonas sp.]